MIKVETEAEEGQTGERKKKSLQSPDMCKAPMFQGTRTQGTHGDTALPLINYKINRNYKSQVVFIHKESGRRKRSARDGGMAERENRVYCSLQ